MYRTILFYVGKKNILLNEQPFTLGQLTAEILNISPNEYHQMKEILLQAEEEINRYRQTKDADHWYNANQHLSQLDRQLCSYQLFRLIKDEQYSPSGAESFLNRLLQQTLEGFEPVPQEELEYRWAAYQEAFDTYCSVLSNLSSFNQTIRFLSITISLH